jgi:hypothetical protein
VACEIQERVKEGNSANATEDQVKKDIHGKNQGDEWMARGKFYKEACVRLELDANFKTLTGKERSSLKTAESKKLAQEFLECIRMDGFFSMLGTAGERMRMAAETWKVWDQLSLKRARATDPEERRDLDEQLFAVHSEFEKNHEYTVFADREDQNRFIKAQDYDDRISANFSNCAPSAGTTTSPSFGTRCTGGGTAS